MKCRNPYIKDGMPFGCGQCMPCRVDKSRIWTHRILLESKLYSDNAFVTLTYNEDTMPRLDDGRGILVFKDMQDWLKRFRKEVDLKFGRKIRFFGVGEYGDQSWRPHFHLILFNYPNCLYGQSRYSSICKNCCVYCDLVRDTWRRGNVLVAECSDATASYTAGYVTKKMTSVDDPRLKGLPPEDMRCSKRPGIGHDAMWDVASSLLQFSLDETEVDVPSSLRHGKNRVMPIGRYLQRSLRKMVGKEPNAPKEVHDSIKEELSPLREAAFDASLSFKKVIIASADAAVEQMEVKRRIFRVRRKI